MSDAAIRTENRSKQSVNKEKTLIFFHLNKTAGTTLREILRRKFPEDVRYTTHSVDELTIVPEEQKGEIKYLEGHFIFGLHEHLPQPSTYITLLRNPVDRVISEYYYLLSRPDYSSLHNELTSKNVKSLEDYVRIGMWYAWNYQTSSLRGIGEGSPPPYGPLPLSTEDLEIAKANLREHFMVVGLTERFDESLVLLKRALGWRIKDILYLKENVGKKRPPKRETTQEAVKLIEEHNELDIQLYEFARQMFEERISQQGSSFRRELQIFRLCNAVYGPIMSSMTIKGVGLLLALVRGEVSISYAYNKVYRRLMNSKLHTGFVLLRAGIDKVKAVTRKR